MKGMIKMVKIKMTTQSGNVLMVGAEFANKTQAQAYVKTAKAQDRKYKEKTKYEIIEC